MEVFDSSLRPDASSTVVHSPRNYLLAIGAVVVLLFAAGIFGLVPPKTVVPPMGTTPPGDTGPYVKLRTNPTILWIPYSQLQIPTDMQVYSDCGGPECGETTFVAYEGTAPQDKVFTLPQDDLTWPDLKVTALSRSAKLVYLPPDVDKETLEATPSGSYLRDKNRVYYLKCLEFACGYDRLTGLDPATFDPRTYAPIR